MQSFLKDPHGGWRGIPRDPAAPVDLDPSLEIILFTDGPLRAELPSHAQILVRSAPAIRRTVRVRGAARKLLYPLRRAASLAWNQCANIGWGKGKAPSGTAPTTPCRRVEGRHRW